MTTVCPTQQQNSLSNDQEVSGLRGDQGISTTTTTTVFQESVFGQESNSEDEDEIREERERMNDEERERYVALYYSALRKERELRELRHGSLNISRAETEEMIRQMKMLVEESDKINSKGQSIKQNYLPIVLALVLVAYHSFSILSFKHSVTH